MASCTIDGDGRIKRVVLRNSAGASCEALSYGAHVTSFKQPGGQELLFMSSLAALDGKKAIRGGIPICFPNFGPDPVLGNHGFARISMWAVEASTDGETATACFTLHDNAHTRSIYPHKFRLIYSVTLSATSSLQCTLTIINLGEQPLQMQALFHNYLSCDIESTAISGFSGLSYFNKVVQQAEKEGRTTISIAQETDNVYFSAPSEVVLHRGTKPAISIRRVSPSIGDTTLWNPWEEKTKTSFDDLEEGDHRCFVCVEPGVGLVAGEARPVVGPGARFTFSQVLKAANRGGEGARAGL